MQTNFSAFEGLPFLILIEAVDPHAYVNLLEWWHFHHRRSAVCALDLGHSVLNY